MIFVFAATGLAFTHAAFFVSTSFLYITDTGRFQFAAAIKLFNANSKTGDGVNGNE